MLNDVSASGQLGSTATTYYDRARKVSRSRKIAPFIKLNKDLAGFVRHTWSSVPCDLVVFVVMHTFNNIYFAVLQQS